MCAGALAGARNTKRNGSDFHTLHELRVYKEDWWESQNKIK